MHSCLELIPDDVKRVFVAFSGGLDSTVLLHLLIAQTRKFEIVPWHFNHGLLDLASSMERFCIEQANSLGLDNMRASPASTSALSRTSISPRLSKEVNSKPAVPAPSPPKVDTTRLISPWEL